MEIKRASQMKVGDLIDWRNKHSGREGSGKVLEVRGRNVLVDEAGSIDWLHMNDLSMCRHSKEGQANE